MIPRRIFFTGVPGSRWSGIAQILEDVIPHFNTTDRTPEREYSHHSFTGHKGAYFGKGMEFEDLLIPEYIDQAWENLEGTRLIKSHDWAYKLDLVKDLFPDDWIMLVYRPDLVSYAWWHEAGGFKIEYPDYSHYKDSTTMLSAIVEQNKSILKFARKHNATWHHFGSNFIKEYFTVEVDEVDEKYYDCLIAIIKP